MQATLARWGNSLGVRIPANAARRAALREGDAVAVSVAEDGAILLRPVKPRPTLDERIARVTARNRQSVQDWGPARGHEAW